MANATSTRRSWLILILSLIVAGSAWGQTATEHLAQAHEFFAEQRYEEAMAACDRALVADPGLADAYRRRGWIFRQLGEFESAVTEFTHAIELEPRNQLHLNGRAGALLNLERYDEALRDADGAIALTPDYANAYITRGLIRKARDESHIAVHDLERAIELDPSNKFAWNSLGTVRADLGDDRGAIDALDRALAIDPVFVTARHNRSWRRRAVRDLTGSVADAEWIVENMPGDTDGYDLLGRARMAQERFADAASAFAHVVELDPKSGIGHQLLGHNRMQAGDLRGAQAALNRALELDPDNANALLDRGMTRRRLRDLDGALEDYGRRMELLPDDPYAYNNRGAVHMDRGEPELAKRDFEKALRLDPGHETAAENLRKADRAIAGNGSGAFVPWTPGPATTVLFDGTLGKSWSPHGAAGGDYASHATLVGGVLRVDVPRDRAWGKVGVHSAQPLVWLDGFGPEAEAEIVFRLDPSATTGFALSLALPGWGGVGGNDPGSPNVTLHWSRDPEGGGAKVELHRNPHRRGEFWSETVSDRAPDSVVFRLRPGEVTVSSPGLFERTEAWTHAASGQGIRIYAFSQAHAAHAPVRMALREIVLNRTFVPEQPPRPADGVRELPVATLFDGRRDPRWQGIGVAGGSFERFARYGDGQLVIDVPQGNSWGKTGLLSDAPILELDRHTALSPGRIRVRVDPAATTGLVLALSGSKVADMWSAHAVWASVFPHEDGTVDLGLHRSPYEEWSRTVRGGWTGEFDLVVGDQWAALSIVGGPTVRGATLPVGAGTKLYATLVSHPTRAGDASHLAVRWIGVDRVVPPGMTGPQRWMLIDDESFDADEFLQDLASPPGRQGGGS